MNGMGYRLLVGLAGVCGLVLLFAGQGCAEREKPEQPSGGSMDAWSHVEFVESYSFRGNVLEDKDLSGIACISPTRCLIGADESEAVQVVEVSRAGRTLSVLGAVSLLGSGEEIDIEAIAAEGDCYYIVGSHGVAKKSGQREAKRYTICRLRVDPTSGMPADGDVTLASLTPILEADATLRPYLGKPLQQKGVNIEGLAIRAGQLFVGLRSPNLDGYAFVLEVGADAVFSKVPRPAYTLHRLMLGKGLGIREIVAARRGFLIIAGNAGSEPSDVYLQAEDYQESRGYELFGWDGSGSTVHKIGPIPNPPGKAEAMTILDETSEQATVLILFDGPREGAPSVYRLR
jgi:hypothetical protein